MRRRASWLIAAIAVLGLMSCSDQTPLRPTIGIGRWSWSPSSPTPPTPVTSGGPADSVLEANRARWSASGVTTYWYRFRWECFCTPDYVRVVDIFVENGAIVSVLDASTGRPVSADEAAYYRTIDGLFDFMREAINLPAYSFHSAYDANLGYPAETGIDYVAQIADEEKGFRIYGLSLLRR